MQVDGEFPSTTRTLQEVGNLTIVHLNENDSGLYECIASNFVADIIATALLVVHSQSSLSLQSQYLRISDVVLDFDLLVITPITNQRIDKVQ